MPSTRDIRRRIKSVKNTAQITKAMQMVAASKMRKAQMAAIAGRPYAQLMNHVLGEVAGSGGDFSNPLMDKREVKKRAIIVVSTDKGLCGGLNSNLMREASKFDRNVTVFVTAGRKASQFIARTKRDLAAEFTYKDAPTFAEARAIAKFARDLFLSGKVDQVDILYTNFISTLNQKPEVVPFLPVTEVKAVGKTAHDEEKLAKGTTEFLFEPNAQQVLDALLPHYLNYRVYQILLEAKASEHSSRMVAMKNATDNAKQILKDLTLEYNKLRQANITKELLEITSAAMAMN
ncbi:MAG TPA: ATP synthase F1 subunit gamma [Verrucomicrobiae bacterium]|jgi:F-type H+-transporting ATPase subunit gamma|nr:ATP synthase F1 subunit gamma [Verrucomicrobiae bacterium]